MATLSVIETILTKFGQNPGFSLRKSVSLTPGPTVKDPQGVLDSLFLGNLMTIVKSHDKSGEMQYIYFYSLKNLFKGFFYIFSHHLTEGLRSLKLQCIIANLFLRL